VAPQKELTPDQSQVGRIAEVVRSGFRYVYNDDQVRLIIPAQVKVYAKKR
jgi:molecular chaperone GrpE (heat shock protein)